MKAKPNDFPLKQLSSYANKMASFLTGLAFCFDNRTHKHVMSFHNMFMTKLEFSS